jgi:hypothetical protein
MKSRCSWALMPFSALVLSSAALISCDAQKDALTLFSRQGLNLLRPARDYIKPGGMIFIAKGGVPEYDDPADRVVADKDNLTDFRAAILAETSNKTTGFSAALSLAQSIMPLSLKAGAQTSSQASLKGIDTTGVRLSTQDLDKLIAKPNTSQAAATELPRGTRVFVVQEIYKATSLDLEAKDSKSFDLTYNDGTAVANCKDTGAPQKPASDSSKPETKNGGQSTAGGNAQSGSPAKPAAKKPSDTQKPQAGTNKPSGQSATTPPKIGAGVAVCVADDFSLKFQTKDPIPFAVRIAELELVGGVVRRRRSAKPFVGTLGNGEISGSLVDDQSPVIGDLKKRAKR